MPLDDLRSRKEAFVTGHAGTSWLEVHISCGLPILLLLLRQAPLTQRIFHYLRAPDLLVDLGCLIIPLIGAWTGLATPAIVAAGVAAALAAAHSLGPQATALAKHAPDRKPATSRTENLRAALSAYRGSLVITTCICILAVDFPVFPRRFAKAETFGTGLMDIGVGSFVAASALTLGVRREGRARSRSGAMQTLVLAALGVLRLVTTSGINYQSHASEYGIHWNFFFTLCALRGLQWALDRAGVCQTPVARGALGFALLLAHQFSLQSLGLIDHVHSPDRDPTSLLSANKEGIGSLPGYAALHLLCACLGDVLAAGQHVEGAGERGERAGSSGWKAHSTSQDSHPRTPLSIKHHTTFLWIVSALLQACFLALQRWVQPVSRRACNATYVVWILALNLQVVLGFAAVLGGRRGGRIFGPLPAALAACNDQMLAVFLAANLLTGAVNASVDTLGTGDWPARGILVGYMAGVVSLAAVLARALPGRPRAA